MVRRTAAESAATRRSLLVSGRALFAEQGFAATSSEQISNGVGMTRGALHHHFADKTDLFREVVVELEHELNRHVTEAAVAGFEREGLWEMVMAGCRATFDFYRRPDYHRIVLADAPSVLGLQEWHAIDQSIGLSSMEIGVTLLMDEGLLAPASPKALSVLLFGALTAAGLALGAGDDAGVAEDELTATFEHLMESLRPQGAASR